MLFSPVLPKSYFFGFLNAKSNFVHCKTRLFQAYHIFNSSFVRHFYLASSTLKAGNLHFIQISKNLSSLSSETHFNLHHPWLINNLSLFTLASNHYCFPYFFKLKLTSIFNDRKIISDATCQMFRPNPSVFLAIITHYDAKTQICCM